ncbi:YihY/virulence factor BrkB family protein [Streptomyces bluensis]|uniref:YihY/virulence factor BrkB family protein n=1 Tax=Streptomyces bluensis TaxID=33897 RepID=UPI0016719BD8|nr:YihY/virulence factor BrkB family protein [Streptomyces bluensis]GGZ57255.1 membrane protein [Streptomyces bluensis]
MDWLKRLPVIGPVVAWLMTTHAWRSYERLARVKWTRLAAAMTFISFLALFPLLTLVATVVAATLGKDQLKDLEHKIAQQVPGIAGKLDIGALVSNAGTVGIIAGALLLFTGISWVGEMRGCLRTVWEKPDPEENPVLSKAKDAGVLLGLGGALLVSLAVSAVASAMVGRITEQLGLDRNGVGGALLQAAAFAIAVLADFLILLYVLTLLPGVHPPRRRLIVAALLGAVGFELLKLLLSGYMQGVASKSMYGAFGVPIALLLWINFTVKLLLYCAAWTATDSEAAEQKADQGAEQKAEQKAKQGAEQKTEQGTEQQEERTGRPEVGTARTDGKPDKRPDPDSSSLHHRSP